MGKVKDILKKTEDNILMLCFVVMGIILFLQIIMRFVFSSPLAWAEEAARYLQIWITFLGIGYGIRRGSHISMDLLRNRMSPKVKYFVAVFCHLACIYAFYILFQSSLVFLNGQNVLSTAMKIPMKIVYVVIPISAVIYIIYTVADIIELTKNEFSKKQKVEVDM